MLRVIHNSAGRASVILLFLSMVAIGIAGVYLYTVQRGSMSEEPTGETIEPTITPVPLTEYEGDYLLIFPDECDEVGGSFVCRQDAFEVTVTPDGNGGAVGINDEIVTNDSLIAAGATWTYTIATLPENQYGKGAAQGEYNTEDSDYKTYAISVLYQPYSVQSEEYIEELLATFTYAE